MTQGKKIGHRQLAVFIAIFCAIFSSLLMVYDLERSLEADSGEGLGETESPSGTVADLWGGGGDDRLSLEGG